MRDNEMTPKLLRLAVEKHLLNDEEHQVLSLTCGGVEHVSVDAVATRLGKEPRTVLDIQKTALSKVGLLRKPPALIVVAGCLVPAVLTFVLCMTVGGFSISGVLSETGRILFTNCLLLFGPGVSGLVAALIAGRLWWSDRLVSVILWFTITVLCSVALVAIALILSP